MTSENKTWENLKTKYLREVEKALSSVQHPRSKDVLADVKAHLEQRFAELKPDQKNWEDFQGIIADMGPPADYAELLGPQAERPVTRAQRKYLVAAASVVAILVAVIWLLVSMEKERADDGSLTKTFPGTLNEGQKIYMEWTESRFASFLNRDEYAKLSDSARKEMEEKWIEVLRGPWSQKYYDSINCLAAIKSERAVKPLLRIATELREKDNRDRWMAVRALGIVGDESVVPELIHLIYHYNQNTRFWAQISLVRLTGVNFGSDWQAWGQWWEEEQGNPAFSAEKVVWTSRADWADEKFQQEKDRAFIEHRKRPKEAAKKGASATYIVTFKPIAPFEPQTARELLDAFNERHPRGVQTHHYRTEVRGNRLVGHICVDSEAGKDAVVSMLDKSGKLTFVNAMRATPEAFETHSAMGQPSLKTGSTQAAAQMEKIHRPEVPKEREMLRQLQDSLEQWLKDHREADAAKCDSLTEQILSRHPGSPEAYFTAARAARLRGEPQKAADILRKAIATYPKEKAPGLNLPVDVVAYFRIGAIARHSGNAKEATKAYESAIKNIDGIEAAEFHKASCYMYLAEIAHEMLRDDELAIKNLQQMTSIINSVDVEKMSPDWAEVWPVLKGWTSYEYARLSDGKAPVSDSSKYPKAADEGVLGLAMMQMSLGGLEHHILLQQTAHSNKSSIDSALAKLALALSYMHSGRNVEARKYLSDLAESDSYFAPYGNELLKTHLDLPVGQ